MILRQATAALFRALFGLLILTVAAGATVAPSGSASTGEGNDAAKSDADALGRSTPQGLVKGLMRAFANGDYRAAERYFENGAVFVRAGRSFTTAASARQFHEILDRVGTITTPAEISPSPEGDLNDGLAQNLERFGTASVGNTEVAFLAKRVQQNGSLIWLVSAETLSEAAGLTRLNARKPFEESLLDQVPEGPNLGGTPISHWLALLLIAGLCFTLSIALVAMRGPVFRLLKWKRDETRFVRFMDASAMPLRLVITAGLFFLIVNSQTLGLSVLARYHSIFVAQIVAGLGLAWLIWRIAETASVYALEQMSQRGQVAAYSIVRFLKRLVQGAILVVFVFLVIRSFGIDVTTALAALGLGGLAVALGAQKLFENLFGSLTLMADRPVRVGDFCKFGEALGTVEDIGIRSTRIRTLDRTVLTVPNGAFSSMQIENFSSRDQFWFHPTLNLRYETSPEQIRYLLQELRAMLYAHPRVNPNPARVRFLALGAHSIDLEIFAYVRADSYDDFLEIQEDLLLRCMEIVKKSGTGFAFPSQTLYFARDDGIDEKKARQAEDAVRNWRDNGSLQIPRFDSDVIRTLRETIAYPPDGAAISSRIKHASNGNGSGLRNGA